MSFSFTHKVIFVYNRGEIFEETLLIIIPLELSVIFLKPKSNVYCMYTSTV